MGRKIQKFIFHGGFHCRIHLLLKKIAKQSLLMLSYVSPFFLCTVVKPWHLFKRLVRQGSNNNLEDWVAGSSDERKERTRESETAEGRATYDSAGRKRRKPRCRDRRGGARAVGGQQGTARQVAKVITQGKFSQNVSRSSQLSPKFISCKALLWALHHLHYSRVFLGNSVRRRTFCLFRDVHFRTEAVSGLLGRPRKKKPTQDFLKTHGQTLKVEGREGQDP